MVAYRRKREVSIICYKRSTKLPDSKRAQTKVQTEGADQANALALIKSSASLSLGVTEHSKFGGYLHGISGKFHDRYYEQLT